THGDIDVVAGVAGSADFDALLFGFRRHVRRPVPGGDNHVSLQVVSAQSHTFGAVKRHGAQVGFVEAIFTHHLAMGFVDLLLRPGHSHAHDVGGVEQAIGVFFQAEYAAAFVAGVIGAHAFENAHTVVQSMG